MTIYYVDYLNGSDSNSGSSWDSAKKLPSTAGSAANPLDEIRVAKSASPVPIGTALWTNLSKEVLLTTPQTQTIDNCEVAWTANPSGDTTVTRTAVATDAKEGSYCMLFTLDSAPQVNTMQAYMSIGSSLDLSQYQTLSFWIKNSASIIDAQWTISLCADVSGSSPVDIFDIPRLPLPTAERRWVPLNIAKRGGGNLGSVIQSISVSSGSITPTASTWIYLDNIFACKSNNLNLQSLISKESSDVWTSTTWHTIQSINGSVVLLDNYHNIKSNQGKGYFGKTELVETYRRETIKTSLLGTESAVLGTGTFILWNGSSGTSASAPIYWNAGYNPITNIQDGQTFFDGVNGTGNFLSLNYKYNYYFSNFSCCRFGNFVNGYSIRGDGSKLIKLHAIGNGVSTGARLTIENAVVNNGGGGISVNYSDRNIFKNVYALNQTAGGIDMGNEAVYFLGENIQSHNNATYGLNFGTSSNCYITSACFCNNQTYGLAGGWNSKIKNVVFCENRNSINAADIKIENAFSYNNGVSFLGETNGTQGKVIINKLTYSGSGLSITGANYGAFLFINNIDNESKILSYSDGTIIGGSATAGGSGKEWRFYVNTADKSVFNPMILNIAQVAVEANAQVIARAYFKKSHATDIAGALVCSGSQIAGVSGSVISYCPDDTNRNLVEVRFTPTENGVVELEAHAWWVANTADENVIVDDIEIIQA